MPLVVVLPCVPANPINFLSESETKVKTSERCKILQPSSLALTTSGLFILIAELITTIASSGTFCFECPIYIFAPKSLSWATYLLSLMSEPETSYPSCIRYLASPLIPTPPIAIK